MGDLYGINHALFYHTGVGPQILEVIPDWRLVMIGLIDKESGKPLPSDEEESRLLELFLAARNPSDATASFEQVRLSRENQDESSVSFSPGS